MKLFSSIIVVCLTLFLQFNVFAQEAKKVPNLKGEKSRFAITSDIANNLHLVFSNKVGSDNSIIFYQNLSNDLNSISKEIRVSSKSITSMEPSVAIANNGDVYITWVGTTSDFLLYMSKSSDQGQSFSKPTIISNNFSARIPKIAIDANNNIYIVYLGGNSSELFIIRSSDGGINFTEPKKISSDNDMFPRHSSVVFDSKGNLYLFYSEANSGTSYLVTSTDGITFSKAKPIAESVANFFANPRAVVDEKDNIFVAFSSGSRIMFIKSADQGKTFSSPINLADSAGRLPDISIDQQNNINIAWEEGDSSQVIFFSRSSDQGITFSPKQTLSKTLSFSFSASTVTSNGKTFISWINKPKRKGFIFITSIE